MAISLKNLSFYGLAGFFVFAGLNHFISPEFYYPLIPDYLPFPVLINIVSGVLEVALGFLLLVPAYKKWAAYGLIALMIAFIPSHVYFIEVGACVEGGLCTSLWVAHLRLWVVHPVLFLWAFSIQNR